MLALEVYLELVKAVAFFAMWALAMLTGLVFIGASK